MAGNGDEIDQTGLTNVQVYSTPGDILSEDMEYPECPECDRELGIFTELSRHSDRFRCVGCEAEFGDRDKIHTSRDLPHPIRDDFAACIIAGTDPEKQAGFREVPVAQVKANLKKADTLLCNSWAEEQIEFE
jgi:transposase-like protein